MTKEIKAPKPWEITLSQGLDIILPVAKLANAIYICILLFASSIIWPKIILLAVVGIALGFAHSNIQKLLLQAVNDDNNKGGE